MGAWAVAFLGVIAFGAVVQWASLAGVGLVGYRSVRRTMRRGSRLALLLEPARRSLARMRRNKDLVSTIASRGADRVRRAAQDVRRNLSVRGPDRPMAPVTPAGA